MSARQLDDAMAANVLAITNLSIPIDRARVAYVIGFATQISDMTL